MGWRKREERTEAGFPEETLLEPAIPRAGALPPHLLTNRPFLWLVLGEAFSHLGFWPFFGAMLGEASFRFQATPTQMAILLGAFSLPFIASTPFQGAVVDRWSPKWVVVLGYLLVAASIPVAMAAPSLPWLYLAMFVQGAAVAAVIPARSALTAHLVEQDRLVQANGMLSAANYLPLVVGPLLGGILIRTHSTDLVYAFSLGGVLASVPFYLAVPDVRARGDRPALTPRDIWDGMATAWRHPDLRLLLFLAAVGFVVIQVVLALEPLFIRGTLGLGRDAIQFLWAAHGAGSLAGAVTVSRIRRGAGRELALVGGGFVAAGAGILVYIGTAVYPIALAGSALWGAAFSFYFAPSIALVQRVAGEEMRGRVTSALGALQEAMALVASIGVVVLGGLVVVRPTLLAMGALLAAAGVLGLRARRRYAAAQREPTAAGTGVRR